MDLSTILSISGKPGLYKLISQTKTGALVESLLDSRRMPAFSHERISSLEDISIFTEEDDVPLKKVLQSIYRKENGGDCIDNKADEKDIRAYMEEVLPNYDRERVYLSDMRKLFSWYRILNANKLIDLEEDKDE
ncbi:MAG TPA: DUF5606 domain-containing protein [Candidatus Onthomorpha intestinigallinarum]|uniref:DUF5606 domain-containing protein n=1 Tax=Candidatus Onthomorpha intestinigallinarum TaxID=2840880 RepID=A0A9D1RFR7_9BACT|nr:DUF5606 domain-containing protein [Candidatus Onthomorpha intestinigallinarum]